MYLNAKCSVWSGRSQKGKKKLRVQFSVSRLRSWLIKTNKLSDGWTHSDIGDAHWDDDDDAETGRRRGGNAYVYNTYFTCQYQYVFSFMYCDRLFEFWARCFNNSLGRRITWIWEMHFSRYADFGTVSCRPPHVNSPFFHGIRSRAQ
jgi:hypothetical protein